MSEQRIDELRRFQVLLGVLLKRAGGHIEIPLSELEDIDYSDGSINSFINEANQTITFEYAPNKQGIPSRGLA